MAEYKVGDTVIHSSHGIGTIIQMDVKMIHERKMLCYVVRTKDLTVWVNADEPAGSSIRHPTPGIDFDDLFAILCSPGEPLPAGWYERKNSLFERMKAGDLPSICYVIRDLTLHRRVKKFNESDKFILERAQRLLLSEWTHARSVSMAQAKNEMMQLLA